MKPVRKLDDEAHHLHEIEQEGESAEAPFIQGSNPQLQWKIRGYAICAVVQG